MPTKSENSVQSLPELPKHALYATAARIGGIGLDLRSYEAILAAYRAGALGKAIGYQNRQKEVPSHMIRSLRWHPVRLISFLESQPYYGAKKKYLDWIAARELATGRYDLFQGWSGECVRTLREARRQGVPSIVDIPTWHRHKGKIKSAARSKMEKEMMEAPFPRNWINSLLVSRQQVLEEYDLASLLLVHSDCAAETFTSVGYSAEKLYHLPLATDTHRFTPGTRPSIFRAVFTGAVIKRKGVHTLLEAWHRLGLKDAELLLVGSVSEEMKPYLKQYVDDTVKVVGFATRPEDYLRISSVHVFPSTCEGSAKTTYDASACALAQITTRESGAVVIPGKTGLVIPANDVDALAEAIEHLYKNQDLLVTMGNAARKLMVENYTWEHFHARLMDSYRVAMGMAKNRTLVQK